MMEWIRVLPAQAWGQSSEPQSRVSWVLSHKPNSRTRRGQKQRIRCLLAGRSSQTMTSFTCSESRELRRNPTSFSLLCSHMWTHLSTQMHIHATHTQSHGSYPPKKCEGWERWFEGKKGTMAEETRKGRGRKYDQSILYPNIKCYNETHYCAQQIYTNKYRKDVYKMNIFNDNEQRANKILKYCATNLIPNSSLPCVKANSLWVILGNNFLFIWINCIAKWEKGNFFGAEYSLIQAALEYAASCIQIYGNLWFTFSMKYWVLRRARVWITHLHTMYTHVYKLSIRICEFPDASQCDSQTRVDVTHLVINNNVSVSFPELVKASTSKPHSQWAKSL